MGNTSYPLGSTANTAVSSAGNAATITYPADPAFGHAFDGLAWSLSDLTSTAVLSVAIAGQTVFSLTVSGCNYVPFRVRSNPGAAVVINLTGGGSVVGRINVLGKQTV